MVNFCTDCGTEIDSDQKFCRGCGNKIISSKNESTKACLGCGAQRVEGHTFCTGCGQKFAASAAHAEAENNSHSIIQSNILNKLSESSRKISEKHSLKSMESWLFIPVWISIPLMILVLLFLFFYWYMSMPHPTAAMLLFIPYGIIIMVDIIKINNAYKEITSNKNVYEYIKKQESGNS